MSEEIKGEAFQEKDLVQYQDASVVSRALVQEKAGSITLFAFDQGQELSEHTAPYDAMVRILDGEAFITVGGTDHALKEGDTMIMPANVPHALEARKRFKMILIMIKEAEKK